MRYKIANVLIYFAFAKAILLIVACNDTPDIEQQIAAITVDTDLRLFHKEFTQAAPDDLPALKLDYPELFPAQFADSIWVAKMVGTDTIHNLLQNAVNESMFDFNLMHDQVNDVYKHVIYYYPQWQPRDIVTVISQVDYNHKVIITSDMLLVAIDTYLGQDHQLYAGINEYRRIQLNRSYLPADVAMACAQQFVKPSMDRTLLGSMVYHGKLHYLQELFAPSTNLATRLGYVDSKHQFAVANEEQMWRYLIDHNLLYSTDSRLQSRFILPAPFSKFYLDVDQQTPGGVGRYIGYRIVSSFMDNNDVSLEDMVAMPADEIFNKSKFKPNK